MKAQLVRKTYDLQLWKKTNDKWRHYSTIMYNKSYGLCKSEKTKRESNKAHFEFYKIVLN